MKSSWIRITVVAFAFTAIGLLALSPSRAADSSSSSGDMGMGACCGQQTPKAEDPNKNVVTCGPGTQASGDTCVVPEPVK